MEINIPKDFIGEGVYVNAEAGIYAIVNPVGEIYIGYSKQLRERIKQHKKWVKPGMTSLARSMFKHGRKSHKFYLIKELDESDSIDVFKQLEIFYIDKYTKEGYPMLNSNAGGSGGIKGEKHIKTGDLYPLVYENSWRPPSER
jgi:hypothetical protein